MDAILDRIIDDLAEKGWSINPEFLSQQTISTLAAETRQLLEENSFHHAGVGKGEQYAVNTELRGDSILWRLENDNITSVQRAYWDSLETLRLAVNASLQLGLFDFEGHLAVYPPGSFYRKHLDRFQNDSLRTLTAILYLNQEWQESDGGQLRIYTDEHSFFEVYPHGGTLVTFLSDRFWHEVLPASRERMSITGWFRTRGDRIL